ncbi:MAG: PKD domain-containing protein [Euryarchaeota archaeon]|nr:PKD domain-containing protein [Euryarchaeota archaeon]
MGTRGNAPPAALAVLLAALLAMSPVLGIPAGGDGARDPPEPDGGWFFLPPTEKVGPASTYGHTSAVCNGTTILLSAARGEHEAFQAVEWTSSDHAGNLSLSAFTGESGGIPESRFEFYKVCYPSAVQTEWPDPLVPISPGQPLEFSNAANNVFLVDIFVPEATPPGTYHANFSMSGSTWPVELTVWDIALPERNTLQTWFDDSASSWAAFYNYTPWSSEHQLLMKNVHDQYRKFRISPGNIALGQVGRYNMTVSNGVVSVDFSGTDPWLEYCLDELGFTSFRFPLTGYSPRRADRDSASGHPDSIYFWGAPPYDMNHLYVNHIGQYIKLVADHYRQKGWLDRAYVYVTDEPIAFNDDVTSYWQHPDYHVVRQFYELVKANAPDLRFVNTVQPVPELFNCTDVWAVPGGYYHELDALGRQAKGQSVWWYNVDAGIASDGVEGRALCWDTFSRGVEGVLYWGTNYWDYYTVGNDPWNGSLQDGDGYLFYPGNKVGLVDDVCPSLRLFLARDGIEDFELLNLYGDIYGYEAARAVAESVAVGSAFAGARYRPVEDSTIYQVREWLAGEIARRTPDLAWTDSFLDASNISAATDLGPDRAWEGSWALEPAYLPLMVDSLDSLGGWRPNNQPHIFSSVAIDTAMKTEGTGSLRIEFWRDDDPGELGGYAHMRNGRVVTSSISVPDWSGFDLLEMDVRSSDLPPGSLYMLVGGESGPVVSSSLHRYARYTGGPGEGWTHFVMDISGKDRSSIQFIEPIVYNYQLEVPFKHYTLWLDNITVRRAGCKASGMLLSRPVDLGPVGSFGGLEHIAQWDTPSGAALSFETRTSADSVNWSAWAQAAPLGRFRSGIASPAARFIQYRALFGSAGGSSPVLSEVRIVYGPLTTTDLFVESLSFDPPVPNANETFDIKVAVGNRGELDVQNARIELRWQEGGTAAPIVNLSIDLPAGSSFPFTANSSAEARPVPWPCLARVLLPAGEITDPDPDNNDAVGWVLVNDYPSASIDAPATALVGDEVAFNASGTTDWQGIDRYLWSFPDTDLHGPVVARSFPGAGTFPYTLTVTDTYGASSSLSASISVFNRTPLPSFVVAPPNGTVLTTFTFISTALDPDGAVVNTTWLFGDGFAGFGRVVNHSFADDLEYTVDCTIDYFENGTLRRATASRALRIENLPPVARFTATNDTAGKRKLLGFDASASFDHDDGLGESSFSWLFGDGHCATGRMASHSFARTGTFNVTLRVTDDDGASSTQVLPVTIINQLPVADFAAPLNVTCNRTFTLDASKSRDPDGSIVAYRWEFDDGLSASGSVVSRKFPVPGIRTVALVVTDDDGATGRLERTVRADPEIAPRPRPPDAVNTASLHPALLAGAVLVLLLVALFLVSRSRPRRREVSRWSLARHPRGPGAPALALGPPAVAAPTTVASAAGAGKAIPEGAPPSIATLTAPGTQHPVPSRQPPRVVRTIPPPPPRLVRAIPAPPETAVIDLEAANVPKVIEINPLETPPVRAPPVPEEPWRPGAGAPVRGTVGARPSGKEPARPVEPPADEVDPTLPSNPWAGKGK